MRFLVVDDHPMVRDALGAVVRGLRDDAEVLEAADAAEAMAALARGPDIDLVLLDLQLPDADGLDVLASLRRDRPATAVVVLSGTRDPDIVRRALAGGAVGYIPKTETRDVMASALALVLAGGVYVPPVALGAIGGAAAPAPVAAAAAAPTPASLGLTGRQLDVLALMMRGHSNKLICRELGLAEPTVKNHVTAILRALDARSRTEAVLAATRFGWPAGPRGG